MRKASSAGPRTGNGLCASASMAVAIIGFLVMQNAVGLFFVSVVFSGGLSPAISWPYGRGGLLVHFRDAVPLVPTNGSSCRAVVMTGVRR